MVWAVTRLEYTLHSARILIMSRRSLFSFPLVFRLFLSAAHARRSIGVVVTNIGAQELMNGASNPHLVLGLVWQLVKLQLLNQVCFLSLLSLVLSLSLSLALSLALSSSLSLSPLALSLSRSLAFSLSS